MAVISYITFHMRRLKRKFWIQLEDFIELRYLEFGLSLFVQMNVDQAYWWYVNICSGNGLVPLGNRPLPEPMLTKINDAAWRHLVTVR